MHGYGKEVADDYIHHRFLACREILMGLPT
jgi:hypothetical protein